MSSLSNWQEIAARKQFVRQNKIPLSCGILSASEIDITSNNDAVDIATKIREGAWTVEEVVTAFCKRAAIAQQLMNCLTEIFFDEAIETAKQMDTKYHGFKVPGYDATVGFVALAEQPANEYSALPALLKGLGAVFYCKTNIPQMLMTADSENNLFGRTLNPLNKSLTASGSSGGDGALVAMRGSVLGVGTDIAGSIRIPSLCCGIYGFKSSAAIVPYAGQASGTTPGRPGIISCAGPMANSARSCLNVPWMPSLAISSKLRVGLIEDDGLFTPSPPVRRTLREAADRLRAAGHEIVPIKLPDLTLYANEIWEHYSIDGSKRAVELITSAGEPLIPSIAKSGLTAKPTKTLLEFMALSARRAEAKTTFGRLWTDHDLDVILMPPGAHTAPPLDSWSVVTYTAVFNYLDWPSVVLLMGKVGSLDLIDEAVQYGEQDKAVYSLYTGPEGYAEAATTIALLGRPQGDQILAAQAVLIDQIMHSA